MATFKPNLIPNNPKDDSFDLDKTILKNGGYDKYLIMLKKDGCRLLIQGDSILTRSLKAPSSQLVLERFSPLMEICKKENILIEGEFYSHGMKFNAIFRFFSKSDVTTEKYKKELEKAQLKDPSKFEKEYDGHSIEFLTTFHDSLKFWLFDGIVLDRPDLVGFQERMEEILLRLEKYSSETESIAFLNAQVMKSKEKLEGYYDMALNLGYEGLVLIHKDHKYKYGRNSLNEGTLLKMKDDALEYDGVIIDIVEATSVLEGTERTINELGRSVTSKKKGDREASGIAKGFITSFVDETGQSLGTFTVCLKGFDNDQRRDLFANKGNFIGRHFKYTAMKPVKDFPRHSYFMCWRDEK